MSRNPHYIRLINSKEWRRLRNRKIMNNPVCEVCDENNRSTLASEVHHIIPVESASSQRQMEQLMFSYSNLQSLCRDCHSQIHRQMFSHSKEYVKANNEKSTKRFIDKFFK